MQPKHDVVTVCNALVDVLYKAEDSDISRFQLDRGHAHLVDTEKQQGLIAAFVNQDQVIELGGSSLNVIRTLAMLGRKVFFCGAVGSDEFGSKIQSRMESLGIDSHLLVRNDHATGSCVVLVTPDGERTMLTHLGASRVIQKQDVPLDVVSSAKIFHFCGYQWDTDGQKLAVREAISASRTAGRLVSFDVADPAVVEHHRDDFRQIIESDADIVFANREEAKLLYGLSPEETAAKIASFGAIAVVKLGAEGAIVQMGQSVHKIAAEKTQVVDTTAAGDMFAAGFLFGLIRALPLDQCGRVGALLASDVISRYGATLSTEVLRRVVGESEHGLQPAI